MDQTVSICIPTFNGSKYLPDCIKSAQNQTYKQLEILIVDDQSQDDSVTIAKHFQKSDQRIRVVQNLERKGLVGNWNECLRLSKGEFIKYHFQDDLMTTDAVELMLLAMKQLNVDLVISDREYLRESDDFARSKKEYYDTVPRLSDFIHETQVVTSGQMIEEAIKHRLKYNFIGEPIVGLVRKKPIIERFGVFDEGLKQVPDFEYWLRVCSNIDIGFLPAKLQIFRVHGKSQSSRNSRRSGVNRSQMDRINLATKLMENDYYNAFRAQLGKDQMSRLVRQIITYNVVRNGYRKSEDAVGSQAMKYFGNNPVDYLKARVNDYLKVF